MTQKWINFNLEPQISTMPKQTNFAHPDFVSLEATEKFEKDILFHDTTSFDFFEKLRPQNVIDLAVHKKKIKEIEFWLQENILAQDLHKNASTPMLLLTGPTGCGKTATVNVLCKVLNIGIMEWITPSSRDEFASSQAEMDKFLNFFSQSKYRPLLKNLFCKFVILVEDFPNFVLRNPTDFRRALELCQEGNIPAIFICTDLSTKSVDLSQILFPQDIKAEFKVDSIAFNSCSDTLLRFALKRSESIFRKYSQLFRQPSSQITEAIIVSAAGDIRSALNQLQFACLAKISGQISLTKIVGEASNDGGKKHLKANKFKIRTEFMSRDDRLGFFHALGKVLNPKRFKTVEGEWRICCDFGSLIEQFSMQPSNFVSFLHENYVKYFGDLEEVICAAQVLSEAQSILDKWTDQHAVMLYSLWLAVLGLMVHNNHKVSKWNQMKAPTKIKKEKDVLLKEPNNLDRLYYNKIKGNTNYRTLNV